jgi:hypothetical protein
MRPCRPRSPRCRPGRLVITAACLLAAVATAVGCGGKRLPATRPVRGIVRFEGRPLVSGAISFYPVDERAGRTNRPAVGVISSDGSYRLSTFRTGDGAMPGRYLVAIESLSTERTIENPEAPEEWAIPRRYGTTGESGLAASVPSEGTGGVTIDFDLTR